MAHDTEPEFLTPADLYAIAERVLGHPPQVRDRHLLHKATARPLLVLFGQEMFPTVFDKAAALLHSLAAHHLFYDGNKRIATAVLVQFLEMNRLCPTWDDETIYHYVLAVAQNQVDIPEIAAWLAQHTEAQ